jgi:hypothetical protein
MAAEIYNECYVHDALVYKYKVVKYFTYLDS